MRGYYKSGEGKKKIHGVPRFFCMKVTFGYASGMSGGVWLLAFGCSSA